MSLGYKSSAGYKALNTSISTCPAAPDISLNETNKTITSFASIAKSRPPLNMFLKNSSHPPTDAPSKQVTL